MSANEVTLTQANFDAEVLNSDIPVLVDFWAEWCGPCRMIGPVIESISKDYAGKLKVGKVNVDQAPDLAGQFGVVSIPMIALFKGGQMVAKKVGAAPRPDIESIFKSHI